MSLSQSESTILHESIILHIIKLFSLHNVLKASAIFMVRCDGNLLHSLPVASSLGTLDCHNTCDSFRLCLNGYTTWTLPGRTSVLWMTFREAYTGLV